MRGLWPDRLAWRIILPVVAVVVAAQFALSWLIFAAFEKDFWDKDQARYAAQQQARVQRLIETLRDAPETQTISILSIANGQDFHAWLAQDTSSLAEYEGFPVTQGATALMQVLTPINGVEDITVTGFVPYDLGDYEAILSAPDRVVYGFGVAEENLLVEAQIRPGAWLRILTPTAEFDTEITPWSVGPDPLFVSLIALSIVPLLILIIRQLVGPIRNLAQFAERIGHGNWKFEEIPETGPLETRQAARALNVMARRIRDFVEDRTRMLAAISHDIASPLTGMRLQAEMVEDPDIRESLIQGIVEISTMSQSTLAFARLDATKEQPQTLYFSEFVADLIKDYDASKVSFISTAFTEGAMADIRQVQMRRALRNIVENALKYGETAEILLDASEREFRLTVTDTGPGLPDTLLEQVFEPFFRGDTSRNPETGGTGLGLSIARNLVRLHGGDVVLRNHTEGGLIAQVILPRSGTFK
ncbi:ATP-binding protein [Roseovarius sp. EL26]|uniref:ATP-binding protein n=1 Tax=Roseovarius sp. EL26 TaxID=2126672 RepID=UPI0013C497BB|nr:ATP-binding protein [Roseovarius sp. EL26]